MFSGLRQKIGNWANSVAFRLGRKPHIFAVRHTTYLEAGATKDVSSLLREIKLKRVKDRLGMEFLPENIERSKIPPVQPGWKLGTARWNRSHKIAHAADRYAKAVYFSAKKRGISLVPLENANSKPYLLHHVLENWLTMHLRGTTPRMALDTMVRYGQMVGEKSAPNEGNDLAMKLLERLTLAETNLSWQDIEDLRDAVSVCRSIGMYQKARELKLRHVVLGGAHAEDAHLLFGAPLTPVNRETDLEQAKARVQNHNRLKPRLHQLLELSELGTAK